MPDEPTADALTALSAENRDLRDEVKGMGEELQIARAELLAACVDEAGARSSLNHLQRYIEDLHDRWADASDSRSLEAVVEQTITQARHAVDESEHLARRASDAQRTVAELQNRVAELQDTAAELQRQLDQITTSRMYRVTGRYRRCVERLLPAGTRRRSLYRRLV